MSTSANSQPRIAIIGGGPAGLTLLLTLVKHNIPATLYEREASSDSRAHLGGMLDLEWNSGQRALRENGLEDVFRKRSRRDAEEGRVSGKDGVPVLINPANPTDPSLIDARPEIDRRVLREVLLDAVPKDAVKWGHALASVRPLGDGTHELTFANGLVVTADLVVGADGAHSRVRPLVSAAPLIYHGITGAEISLAPAVAALPEHADIRAGVGAGSNYVTQDERMICFQANGDGRIRAYAWHRAPREWTVAADPQATKAELLKIYEGWAPWVLKFIREADEDAIYTRALWHLPVGHQWAHKVGVTLIGEAAHLMSPFAAAGANLGMLDGLELGLAIAGAEGKSADARDAAVAAWEAKMFPIVERFAALAAKNIEIFLGKEAPQSVADAFKYTVDLKYA